MRACPSERRRLGAPGGQGAALGLARAPACGWAMAGWCGGDAAAGQAGPWLAGLVGPRRVGSGATRAGCVGVASWAEGERAGGTGWAEARREERRASGAGPKGKRRWLGGN